MKKPTRKPTITIGIPAYNEERNIKLLIACIKKQKLDSAKLSKVLVYSDASTDKTVPILRNMKWDKLTITAGRKRKGKSFAMNEIIKKTTTDILVLLDADILIRDDAMIQKLVNPIVNKKADLTSARVKEYWTKSKFEDILKISMLLKKDIFESFKNGNNIYTCHGRARAFSRPLYTSILFNEKVVAEDAYAYLFSVYNKFKYVYTKRAQVHYRLPGTFMDHKRQSIRFIQSYRQLAKEFGPAFIREETRLPKQTAVPFVLKYLMRYPITMGMYVCILVYMRISSLFKDELTVTWRVSPSTKAAFTK